MSLVLLRRLMSEKWDELWPAWGKDIQEQVCEQVLKLAGSEQNASLRKRLADVIAEIARGTIGMFSVRESKKL